MRKQLILWLAAVTVIAFACQKEFSFEGSNSPAKGSLQSDLTGDCLPKSVNGTYTAGVPLVPATNTITVQVNVTKTGTYTIGTDTVNGYYFRGVGTFTALGNNTVTLRGNGTPFANGTNNFVVSFDGTVCDIQVTVTQPGAGTMAGAPGACAPITVNGSYSPGVALTAANNVVVQVNVTTAGILSLTTDTVAGIWFNYTGSFAAGNNQNVTLVSNGAIPGTTTPGPQTFTVKLGTSKCTFIVNIAAPAAYTINCAGVTVNGTYTQGVALTASNTITLPITVTTAGAYSITATVAGMTFTGSGTLTAASTSITLTGTGTPTASGTQTLTIGSCAIPITVAPSASNAVYTLDGQPGTCSNATVNGFYVASTALDASNTVDIHVTVTTAGAYPALSTTAANGMTFSAPAGTLALGAQTITLTGSGTPSTAGDVTIPFTAGGTTCSFKVHVLPNDYFPRTTYSNWSYEFDDVSTDSVVRYVKNLSPVTLNGNQYTIFMQDDGTGEDSSGYYRRNSGDYFEFMDIGTFIGYDNPLWDQYTMLKDNVAAPVTWKSPTTGGYAGTITVPPSPPQNLNIRFSYSIQAGDKDITKTVATSTGSVTYKNVIVVTEKYEVEVTPGVWQDLTATIDYYGKSYYARGVGLILFEPYNAAGVIQTGKMEMRRFYVY